jgi:hypothetical protein
MQNELLKRVGETLFYESHLSTLPHPAQSTLSAFRSHFFNERSNSSFPTLGANSSYLYDDIDDLVVLGVQEDRDRLTAFVQDQFAWAFKVRVYS